METVISAPCEDCCQTVWFEPDSDFASRTVKLCEDCETARKRLTLERDS